MSKDPEYKFQFCSLLATQTLGKSLTISMPQFSYCKCKKKKKKYLPHKVVIRFKRINTGNKVFRIVPGA